MFNVEYGPVYLVFIAVTAENAVLHKYVVEKHYFSWLAHGPLWSSPRTPKGPRTTGWKPLCYIVYSIMLCDTWIWSYDTVQVSRYSILPRYRKWAMCNFKFSMSLRIHQSQTMAITKIRMYAYLSVLWLGCSLLCIAWNVRLPTRL